MIVESQDEGPVMTWTINIDTDSIMEVYNKGKSSRKVIKKKYIISIIFINQIFHSHTHLFELFRY